VQAGAVKDKAYATGKGAYDSAADTGQQAYDATKGAAEDLAATLKSYMSWAQTKASELTKTSKDTTNVGSRVCLMMMPPAMSCPPQRSFSSLSLL